MASPPFFDLSSDLAVEPMDMADVLGPSTPVGGEDINATLDRLGGRAQGPQSTDQKREWLKLAVMLPLIMKGGPGALQGFLAGTNQATERTQEQARIDQARGAQQQQQQAVLDQRDRQIAATTANALEQRKQDLLKTFLAELGKTTSDADVQALVGLYGPQAQALGIPAGRLMGFAQQKQTPARLRTRLITEAWGRLSESAKATALQHPQFVIPLRDGTTADLSEVAKMVGLPVDPTTGQPVRGQAGGDLEKSSPVVQGAAALRSGDMEEYARLLKAQKEFGQADDRPPDPELAGIRRDLASLELKQAQREERQTAAKETEVRDAVLETTGEAQRLLLRLIDVDPAGAVTLKPATRQLFGARVPGLRFVPGTATATANADLRRLIGNAIIDVLNTMKRVSPTGSTGFGQFTEKELALVRDAATTLTNSLISDEAATDALTELWGKVERAYRGAQAASDAGGEPAAPTSPVDARPAVTVGAEYLHPQHGRVRVVGLNPDGTARIEKVGAR